MGTPQAWPLRDPASRCNQPTQWLDALPTARRWFAPFDWRLARMFRGLLLDPLRIFGQGLLGNHSHAFEIAVEEFAAPFAAEVSVRDLVGPTVIGETASSRRISPCPDRTRTLPLHRAHLHADVPSPKRHLRERGVGADLHAEMRGLAEAHVRSRAGQHDRLGLAHGQARLK